MTKSCLRALQFFRDFGKGECNIQWRPNYFDLGKIVYPEQVEDWLKSLRQRLHWKPSEEQMEVYTDAIYFLAKHGFKDPNGILESLYSDLKKLM